jgi:hypothetical protein
MFDNIRGAHFQTLAVRLALDLGDSTRLARALTAEAPFLAAAGNRDRPARW